MIVTQPRGCGEQHRSIVYSIQILRGIAATLVVCHHAILQLSFRTHTGTFELGAIGVDIFFAISGFVIYLTGRKLTWAGFIARRIARVVPLYWFFLLLKIAFVVSGDATAVRNIGSLGYIVQSFLFVPAFRNASLAVPLPLITAGWTLNFEMYFYAMFTLGLAFVGGRRVAVWTSGAIVTLIAIAHFLGVFPLAGHWPPPFLWFHPIALEFVAGMFLAYLWTIRFVLPIWMSVVLAGIATFAVIVFPVPDMFAPVRPLVWGVPAVLWLFALVNVEQQTGFTGWPPLLFLGDASYAIYLSQTATLPLLDKLLARTNLPLAANAIALILAASALGCIAHLFVEKPLTRFVSKLMIPHRERQVVVPLVESAGVLAAKHANERSSE